MHRLRNSMDVRVPCTIDSASLRGAPRHGALLENRFRIDAVIATGTHAIVYAATNVVTGKVVAIKWPRKRRSFDTVLREARLAARVQHPAVVDVYDIGQHDGAFFLTMECVRGVTLRAGIARGTLDFREFMAAFESVLGAVNALHSTGIAHCDLKPANILLSVDDEGRPIRPKLIDFGSAKELSTAAAVHTDALSSPVVHPGSKRYMPREQQRCDGSFDHRVDIYALGMILGVASTRCSQSNGISCSDALRAVIARATATDCSDRYASVSEFSSALRTVKASAWCRASKKRRLPPD